MNADTSQYWYFKVRQELSKLVARPSDLDQGSIFFVIKLKLSGLLFCL